MGQSIKAWIGLTAVVALLIVGAGWLLVISPTQSATADTRAQIETEENLAITLNSALTDLKAKAAVLDESKAELQDLRLQLPSSPETVAFRRLNDQRASAAGVTILTITTDIPTVYAPAAAPAETAPEGEVAPETPPSPSPSPSLAENSDAVPPATVTTTSGQLLVAVPMEIIVMGTYEGARAFVASLQDPTGRLFLVSGVGLVNQLEASATSGRPATSRGDVEVSIKGMLLVLTPGEGLVVEPEDDVELPPLPYTERNPFAPVGQ